MNRPSIFLVVAIIVAASAFFLAKWPAFTPAVQPEQTLLPSSEFSKITQKVEKNAASVHLEPEIFSDVDETILDKSILREFLEKRPVLRYRVVKINSDILKSKILDEFDNEIVFKLFEDTEIVTFPQRKIEKTTGLGAGLLGWIGQVRGYEHSSVTFTIGFDGTVYGSLRGSFGVYQIEPSGQPNSQIIWQRDPSFRPPVD